MDDKTGVIIKRTQSTRTAKQGKILTDTDSSANEEDDDKDFDPTSDEMPLNNRNRKRKKGSASKEQLEKTPEEQLFE